MPAKNRDGANLMRAFTYSALFVYCPSYNASGCSRTGPVFRTHRSDERRLGPPHLRRQACALLGRRHAFLSSTSAPDPPVIRPDEV